MKPRICRYLSRWVCFGDGVWGAGETPAEAYAHWAHMRRTLRLEVTPA